MPNTSLGFPYPTTADGPSPAQIQALAEAVQGYFVGDGLVNPAFQPGWSNYGTGDDGTQYDKHGGMVTLYLNSVRTTGDAHGAGSPILLLDPGFRPPRRIRTVGFSTSGASRVFSVYPSGMVTADLPQTAGNGSVFGSIVFPAAAA